MPPAARAPAETPSDPMATATDNPISTPRTGASVVDLEGFVARLRGYVGGSFTHMLHRQPHLEEHVRNLRREVALNEAGASRGLIEAIAAKDYDLDAVTHRDTRKHGKAFLKKVVKQGAQTCGAAHTNTPRRPAHRRTT